jgi:hypothetical protein
MEANRLKSDAGINFPEGIIMAYTQILQNSSSASADFTKMNINVARSFQII